MAKEAILEYWTIDTQLSLKKQEQFDKTIECRWWVFMIDTGYTHITNYGTEYKIIEYRFFNSKRELVEFANNGWSIFLIQDKGYQLFISISDTLQHIRTIEPPSYAMHPVKMAVNFLNSVSKYPNWQIFDLAYERDYYLKKIKAFEDTKSFKNLNRKFNLLSKKSFAEINNYCQKKYSWDFYNFWFAYQSSPNFNKDFAQYFEDN